MNETGKRILIVTDAWRPQINGVVRSLEAVIPHLERAGYQVHVIAPGQNGEATVPIPFYREIRLEPFGGKRIEKALDEFRPDYIHIATEGTLGMAARHICLTRNRRFTTAYHTCFPEYIAARLDKFRPLRGWGGGIAAWLGYSAMRRFHNAASAVMVATPEIEALLRNHRIAPDRIARWSRGVDMDAFQPGDKHHPALAALPHPIALYVGRVAIEKNIAAFLDAPFAGSKLVIGDGPQLASLRAAYPAVTFMGAVTEPAALAGFYRAADVFAFPSKTDTFGLVLLEAMACGLPIACCDGPGQRGILARAADNTFHRINDNLCSAMAELLAARPDPALPRAFVAAHYSWTQSAREFIAAMQSDKPPLRDSFLRRLLFDYIIGIPLRLLERIPGLFLLQWGGLKLLKTSYRAWTKRKQPPDDFA